MKHNHVYAKLYYHIIWKTKNLDPLILPKFKDNLYKYIAQIIKNKGWHLMAIGGTQNHVHILVQINPKDTIPDVVCKIKSNSSRFIKETFMMEFVWQKGYGVFTVDRRSIKLITNYILKQEEHHRIK